MKRNCHTIIVSLLFALMPCLNNAASATAVPSAGFYRAWQGNKLDSMAPQDFLNALPEFMNGIHVYGDVLNQYLVAVPPADRPAYVPDEFALVALTDEESYRRVRATPEGKAYGDSHWTLFEKAKSTSLPLDNAIPSSLVSGRAYDVIASPIDWRVGYSTFFLGLRKSGMSKGDFLHRLSQHVQLASMKFQPQGLRGYITMANADYEAAFMNWESEAAMTKAFASPGGQEVSRDGEDLFKFLQWGGARPFDGVRVSPGGIYKSK